MLSTKFNVSIIEISNEKIKKINSRESPIKDYGIISFFEQKKLHLHAGSFDERLIAGAHIAIICLPTNYDEIKSEFETNTITKIVDKINRINPNCTKVIRSTVPIGYTDNLIESKNIKHCFFSPEFLREGHALEDNLYPERIVVGSNDSKALEYVELLKLCSNKIETTVVYTDNRTAESIKLASNSFLDAVSFFNEIDCLAMEA